MSKPIDDEWWTTDTVCALLKVGKRSLWNLRKDPAKAFPPAIKPGGKVILFRAADVRNWLASRPTIEEQKERIARSRDIPSDDTVPAPKEVIASEPRTAEAIPAPSPRSKRKRSKAKTPSDQLSLF